MVLVIVVVFCRPRIDFLVARSRFRGVVNFEDPVEGPLVGNNTFLHALVLAEELLHGLSLLLRLVQDLLEVAAIIYNRDVAVVKVHDAAIGWRRRNGASVRNLLGLSGI